MNKCIIILAALSLSIILQACTDKIGIDEGCGEDIPKSSCYIAVFGDIQYLTDVNSLQYFQHSVDWIINLIDSGYKFNSVLHTGDITGGNDLYQWGCFSEAMKQLPKKVPFFSMIGDHDYTWEGSLINDRYSTYFNNYVQFPLSLQKVIAWFEKGRMENIVVENTINGQRLDLLILEFGPREEVVAWADSYVKAHPDHHFILMTHEYLEKGGGRRTKDLKIVSRLRNTTYNTPEQLWDNLIKCNDNIRLVLCGHVGGLYTLTVDINDFGREIPQIQHNIQSPEYRYDNWLMLWAFPADRDSANVFIYNTKTKQYFNDQECLFKFRYRD